MDGAVVGVVGARGGAGASVVAACLARAAARRRVPACVVDLADTGGLDVLLGVEDEPGVRWPDLADARGRLDGDDLAARLPRWDGVGVVSATTASGPVAECVVDVVTALAESVVPRGGLVVLDLPRPGAAATGPVPDLLPACDELLVVTPLDVPSVAGAAALRPRLGAGPAALVVRGPAPGRLGAGEVARAVGLDVAATVRRDRRLPAAVERGHGPAGGPLDRAGRVLAARYLGPRR
ncbi:septum site-determining protein Ssd [Cellulosimicrobium marinum]|uniref:septum site-determining protein Ssd n=1 Tax=Cellulosimicrobium marinum TaxID=1638992 RepID=UPI001E360E42|nr:septum site-determining protein Ssd [Cellulosimicrobium marinum]MCB7135249.1 pilus assembly protein FlpE [Cellulosimicrobium marinum]